MICTIKKNNKKLQGFISLPSSKSLSNRILIIKALCPVEFKIHNLSTSDDTLVLQDAINNLNNTVFDIGAAGTAMRFLTAYFSLLKGERVITGSERMKQRPISELVDILREFGARIEYAENDGFPPLKIIGNTIKKNGVTSTNISGFLTFSKTERSITWQNVPEEITRQLSRPKLPLKR